MVRLLRFSPNSSDRNLVAGACLDGLRPILRASKYRDAIEKIFLKNANGLQDPPPTFG